MIKSTQPRISPLIVVSLFVFDFLLLHSRLSAAEAVKYNTADRVGYVGALVGASFDPGNFDIAFNAGYHFSEHVSVGPLLQAAFFGDRLFTTTSVGPTFHLPIGKAMQMPNLEWTVTGQLGHFYRRVNGFNFNNFVFVAGTGLDYRIADRWAVQGLFLVNPTNDNVDTLFYSLVAGVKYLF